VARERLLEREDTRAISNGRLELLESQQEDFDPLTDADRPLLKVDTGQELAAVLQEITSFLDEFIDLS
jgi:hypothetical protein